MSRNLLKNYRLGELVEVSQGLAINAKTKYMLSEVGLPLLRITDLINEVQIQFVDPEHAPKKCLAFKEDIIYTRTGQVGLVFKGRVGVIHNNCFKVIPNSELVDSDYLFWFLSQNKIKRYANDVASGSVQKDLNHSAFKSIPIELPPLEYQKTVGPILNSLTKKIELNRQTNQTLEAIAQAIFKSWFVDFDPTHAKIAANECAHARTNGASTEELIAQLLEDGRWTKKQAQTIAQGDPELAAMSAISGQFISAAANKEHETHEQNPQLTTENDVQGSTNVAGAGSARATLEELRQTAALFPSALLDSELGEIPEGWEVQLLEDVIELAYGKALKKTERVSGQYPVYGSGGLTGTHNKALVEGPGIIVGRKGTVGSIYWVDSPFFPIDTVFYVKPKIGFSLVYVYYLLKTLGLENMNTDAAVPGLNRNNVYKLEVVKPSESVLSEFSRLIEVVRDKLSVKKKEVKTLETIRDSLLPKLLSGELELGELI